MAWIWRNRGQANGRCGEGAQVRVRRGYVSGLTLAHNGADSWLCLLSGWTGLAGCLIADMGETGQEYDTSWLADIML